ncbi:MAG: cellobiose phosphorylase, partial [Candidatus Omnitrophica bacterium]|nr:cellobiose phosphorylase [Candidatus Omnitrophota bacterium]
GVWPYLTTRLYIHKTGDLTILAQRTTYFRDHQLRRAQEHDTSFRQDDYLLRTGKTPYEGTVLEHLLVQILTQFFNVGEHNIVRLENADWNDGLDMAPRRGESVTFSSMYAHNLGDICNLLGALKQNHATVPVFKELVLLLDTISGVIDYNDPHAKQKLLTRYFDALTTMTGETTPIAVDALIGDLTKKSVHLIRWIRAHEWLPEGFFNGYYDNHGERVEGKRGAQTQMMLPPQVFAIMSGVASDQQVETIWASTQRYLKDKRLGGFRLNTDFGEPLLTLGRAFGFSYGDKENGAFFNHMVIMFANALYKRGFITHAFEVMDSIYRMATAPGAGIPPVLPEYFNGQGRGLYLYLTGSASWYTYTIFEEILGIKFYLGDIIIEPKLIPANFFGQTIECNFSYAEKTITTIIHKGSLHNGTYRIKKVFLDAQEVSPHNEIFCIRKNDITAKRARTATITVTLA